MSTGDRKEMQHRKAILFPHSYLPKTAEERMLSSFETLTICKPWYMEDAATAENRNARIDIIHPPEELKPPNDFMKLLAEYRLWMSQNRGYTPLVPGMGEDAAWEIRDTLRHGGKDTDELAQEHAIKWHLILHLERELEENQTSADEMLLRVKAERSPLAEAIGEETSPNGLFDDLPLSDSHPSIEERHLRQVLSAWFGLFGRSVPKDSILLTMTPAVLSFGAELFANGSFEPSSGESASLQRIDLPAYPPDASMDKDPIRAGLSEKTLVLVTV